MEDVAAFAVSQLSERRRAGTEPYLEFLRSESLSMGVYELRAGELDGQEPHREDEVYVVTAGQATLWAGGREIPASEGSVIYVAGGVDHRFHDITEDLTVLVLFAPAESST